MKKISCVILITILLLFSFASCNKEDNPISALEESNAIRNLKVGNQWTYRITSYDSLGVANEAYTTTFTIVRDTVFQGETWYILSNGKTENELLINRTDGLWNVPFYYLVPTSEPVLEAKYPVSINDSWTKSDSTITKCTAKDIIVNSPVGNYKCVQYSILSKAGDILVNYYYACKFGNIKGEYYMKDKNGKYYLSTKKELIDVQIN
jgi:hypothetical protein